MKLEMDHLALGVTNLAASKTFYEDVLLLSRIDEPFHDGKHEWFDVGGGRQLHLILAETAIPLSSREYHLSFRVSSIEEFVAHLSKLGVPFQSYGGEEQKVQKRVDGVKQLYIKDPDGFWIEINDSRP